MLSKLNTMEEETVRNSPNEREEDEEETEEEKERKKEEKSLVFLDSLDSYITFLDSLSTTLRKGWLELASARHSMGSSRISSVLLDLKEKSAATTLQVSEGSQSEVHYELSKWAPSRDEKDSSREVDFNLQKSTHPKLRHRGSSHLSEESEENYSDDASDNSSVVGNNFQRERSKSLAVFGTLVSPKLRSAQVSFETALETIVEIANMRSSMLSAFAQLQKEKLVSD